MKGEVTTTMLEMLDVYDLKPLFVVYEFYNENNECLYVGKSRDFYSRLWQHLYDKEKKVVEEEISYIKFTYLKNIADQALVEVYKILKNRPKYNKQYKYDVELELGIDLPLKEESVYLARLLLTWQQFIEYKKVNNENVKHERNFIYKIKEEPDGSVTKVIDEYWLLKDYDDLLKEEDKTNYKIRSKYSDFFHWQEQMQQALCDKNFEEKQQLGE